MSKTTDIRLTNPHLARRVKLEAQRRGYKAVARAGAELITERLTQIEEEQRNQRPAEPAAAG